MYYVKLYSKAADRQYLHNLSNQTVTHIVHKHRVWAARQNAHFAKLLLYCKKVLTLLSDFTSRPKPPSDRKFSPFTSQTCPWLRCQETRKNVDLLCVTEAATPTTHN